MPAEGEGLRVGGVVSGDGDEARIEHEAVLEPSDVVDQDVVPAPGPKRRPRELRDEEPEVYREDRDHEEEHPDQRHEGAHAFLIADEGAGHCILGTPRGHHKRYGSRVGRRETKVSGE